MSSSISPLVALCIRWPLITIRRNPLSCGLLLILVPSLLIMMRIHDVYEASLRVSSAMFSPKLPPPRIPNGPSSILIVTAYFPLSKSKHSMYQYNTWMSNFLGRVTTDVYMFSPPELAHSLRGTRGALPLHLNTSYSSIDAVPYIAPLLDQFVAQHSLDADAWKHGPDLYKIWTAKPWFVREAMANVEPGRYKWVFWVDAGSIRQPHAYGAWPDIERIERAWEEAEKLSGTPREDLVFIPMEHSPDVGLVRWTEADGPIRSTHDMSEGSLFGGSPKAMEWWFRVYDAYFHHYLDAGFFVGNDQLVMNALFFLYSKRFITTWNRDPAHAFDSGLSAWYGGLGYCGDPWFAYEFFFASDEDREAMNKLWSKEKFHWDFWRARPPCIPENILTMPDVLSRTFGPNWHPPVPSLYIAP